MQIFYWNILVGFVSPETRLLCVTGLSNCFGTRFVDQVPQTQRYTPTSASRARGLKGCVTTSSLLKHSYSICGCMWQTCKHVEVERELVGVSSFFIPCRFGNLCYIWVKNEYYKNFYDKHNSRGSFLHNKVIFKPLFIFWQLWPDSSSSLLNSTYAQEGKTFKLCFQQIALYFKTIYAF